MRIIASEKLIGAPFDSSMKVVREVSESCRCSGLMQKSIMVRGSAIIAAYVRGDVSCGTLVLEIQGNGRIEAMAEHNLELIEELGFRFDHDKDTQSSAPTTKARRPHKKRKAVKKR